MSLFAMAKVNKPDELLVIIQTDSIATAWHKFSIHHCMYSDLEEEFICYKYIEEEFKWEELKRGTKEWVGELEEEYEYLHWDTRE